MGGEQRGDSSSPDTESALSNRVGDRSLVGDGVALLAAIGYGLYSTMFRRLVSAPDSLRVMQRDRREQGRGTYRSGRLWICYGLLFPRIRSLICPPTRLLDEGMGSIQHT